MLRSVYIQKCRHDLRWRPAKTSDGELCNNSFWPLTIVAKLSMLDFCKSHGYPLIPFLTPFHMISICIVYEDFVYFISMLHLILKKSVRNFCFLKLFCSLVQNENTKGPGFYKLLVKHNKEFV